MGYRLTETLRERLLEYFQYVERLPELDQGIYDLVIQKRYKQRAVADIYGMTQGAVSSRLKRMTRRLRYLEGLSYFDLSMIDQDLQDVFDPMEREILHSMATTTCQEETARRLNRVFNLKGDNVLTQVKVRHRFIKAWNKLMSMSESKYQKYIALFGFVWANLYVLHEIKTPQFERGMKREMPT